MKIIRSVAIGVLAAALIAGTTSCSSTGSDETKAGDTLVYWSMWTPGAPQEKVLTKVFDEFTKETGIHVDVQWIGLQNIQKIAPTLNQKTGPVDLIDAAQRNIQAVLVRTDSYKKLGNVLKAKIPGESITVGDSIPEDYWKMVSKDGEPWMIPYQLLTSGFWYNCSTHPDIESNPPKNWTEFMSVLDELKSKGEVPLAQDADVPNYNLFYFAELGIRNIGHSAMLEAAADPSGQKLAAEGIRKTAQQIEALVKGNYFSDGYKSSKYPAQHQMWVKNGAAFIYDGSYIVGDTSPNAAAGFKYCMIPTPSTSPNSDMSLDLSFIGFAIPHNAPHSENAEKFIEFFLNKDRVSGIAGVAKNLTPRPDIPAPAELQQAQEALKNAPGVHQQLAGFANDYGEWNTKVLLPLVNSLVFGNISSDEFMKELPAQSKDYWASK